MAFVCSCYVFCALSLHSCSARYPNTTLPMRRAGEHLNVKEVHYNQHGLLLLTGKGIYRLGSDWYPVQVGAEAAASLLA